MEVHPYELANQRGLPVFDATVQDVITFLEQRDYTLALLDHRAGVDRWRPIEEWEAFLDSIDDRNVEEQQFVVRAE